LVSNINSPSFKVGVWLKSYKQQHQTVEDRQTPVRGSVSKKMNFTPALGLSKSAGFLTLSPSVRDSLKKSPF